MTNSPDSAAAMRAGWRLEPGIAFLNHGSFGACPGEVLDAQHALRERLEREPVRFLDRELEPLLDAARGVLASFLGAEPDGLAFVANATTGVNTVLASLTLRPGDELLVTDHAYPACRNALDAVAARTGAAVVVARLPFPITAPDQVVDAVLAACTDTTRILLLDHVTSPTGLVLPVEKIVPALRDRGIDTLVDGAHAPGMLPLDLDQLGAAYYTGNCHKWICAPKGAGFLHVRADRRDRVRPLVISHGAGSPRTDRSRFRLEFDWVGTADPTPFLAVPMALSHMASRLSGGWPELRRRNHALVCRGRAILCETLGIDVPAPATMLGSLASVPLPDAVRPPAGRFDPLQTALFDAHRIEVPVFAWPQPPRRLLRISAQIYNDEAQYRALAAGITAYLR